MSIYEIKTVPAEENILFYSDEKEMDAKRGCIGHLRADFGYKGEEFFTSWWDHCEELKTQAFKDELDAVINHLRKKGNMLHSLSSLTEYCRKHPDAQLTVKHRADTYGFKIGMEAHSYYIRGMLTQGDYNLYVYCFVRDMLEKSLAVDNQEPKQYLWGQIGATFHLTRREADTLLQFDNAAEQLFYKLVSERRYEIDDQFYVAASEPDDEDIFIHLNQDGLTDSVWAGREDKANYPKKIWCRMGIEFPFDAVQMQTLKKQVKASAELIFSLTESGMYKVKGQCLFEGELDLDEYVGPDTDMSINYFADVEG